MLSILDRVLSRMAGNSQADLGFKGIFQILAGIPADKLIHYRHKLSCLHQDQKTCHLLHVMILLCLGREGEARVHLNRLRDDTAADHLFQCCWGNAGAKRTPPQPLKEHAKVAWTVAEIYSLLADEKLCEPLARDEAYRTAIKAFQASNVQEAQLRSLLDEATDKCGPQFLSTVRRSHFGALSSGRREFTQPTRSNPVPIDSSSPLDNPQPLCSTGSPVSYISSFEISETSTALAADSPCNIGVPLRLPPTSQTEETSSTLLDNGCSINSGEPSLPNSSGSCFLPDPKSTLSPKASPPCPTQCTPAPKTAATERHLPPHFQTSPLEKLGSAAFAGGAPRAGANSSAPAQITSLGAPLSFSSSDLAPCPSAGASSVLPPAEERRFYTFVVLHAAEDESLACRVKEQLEALGVSNGATFSEDFLVPGCCQLNCFQNALDNSAFTLLLLTENFKGRVCAYQRNAAVWDSLTRFCKSNSVIPFVPKESSRKMPPVLASLVPLEEKSLVFAKRVKNTFTPTAIRQKKATWDIMQQIQEREQRQEREREDLQMQQRLSALNLHSPAPTPAADVSRLQGPPGSATQVFPTSTMSLMQLGPDQVSSQPFMFSVGSPNTMPATQLIIQNAQMVQIGDYNYMQVEKSNAVLGTDDEAVGGEPVLERGTSPETENQIPASRAPEMHQVGGNQPAEKS